jgi:hypothetical protein
MGGNDEEIGKFATLRLKVASRLMTLKEAIAEAWAIVNGKSVDH